MTKRSAFVESRIRKKRFSTKGDSKNWKSVFSSFCECDVGGHVEEGVHCLGSLSNSSLHEDVSGVK